MNRSMSQSETIKKAFNAAKDQYTQMGVDVEAAMDKLDQFPISSHCWQADDVGGFETPDAELSGGGIQATGNYPGKATNIQEHRMDLEKAMSLIPGKQRLNLHAIYGDFHGFPPTLLVTGTRDLFLSNTARTHIKLLQAGAVADLLVYEGVSHGDYLHVLAAPEAQHFLEVLDQFFIQHLQLTQKTAAKMLKRMNSALNLGLVRSTS